MAAAAPAELGRFVASQNEGGGSYHHIDFGSGVVLEGDYDLANYLPYYDLPADMAGLRVLDVGTATGFLALECAARGAAVTAIDVHDHPPLLDLAAILKLPIEYRQQSVYDLAPEGAAFDVVACGSLLLHLTDPLLALRRMRSACASTLHVTTASPKRWWRNRDHRCYFVGHEAAGMAYYSYWEISGPGLARMLAVAGFARASRPRYFVLRSRPGRTLFATPHVALTASVRPAGA